MSAEENKALVRRWIDAVYNNQQLDRVVEFYAPTYTLNGKPMSIAEITENLAEGFSISPDLRVSIDAMIAEGDTVAYRWTWRGTHQGMLKETPFGPIAPTGKAYEMTGITYLRIADGKIVDDWGESDSIKAFQQLGVLPTPEQASA